MCWPDAKPLETLPDDYGYRDILVFSPCDGWHVVWAALYGIDEIKAKKNFTHWMPAPPAPEAK